MAEFIDVQVVHASPGSVFLRSLRLPEGSTVKDALQASGALREFPGQATQPDVGIHSRRVALEQVLRDGDRVELYRPLQLDPMEARRRRASKKNAN